MNELFNKPILDQMYEFRKEDFEQTVYDNNSKIKEIEFKVCELSENFINFLKDIIPIQNDYKKAVKMFNDYNLTYSKEKDFWSLVYFKLGMIESEKIKKEFFANKEYIKERIHH